MIIIIELDILSYLWCAALKKKADNLFFGTPEKHDQTII